MCQRISCQRASESHCGCGPQLRVSAQPRLRAGRTNAGVPVGPLLTRVREVHQNGRQGRRRVQVAHLRQLESPAYRTASTRRIQQQRLLCVQLRAVQLSARVERRQSRRKRTESASARADRSSEHFRVMRRVEYERLRRVARVLLLECALCRLRERIDKPGARLEQSERRR